MIVIGPADATAQHRLGVQVGLGPVSTQVSSKDVAETDKLSGVTFGGRAGLRYWKLLLDVRYLEGTVESSSSERKEDVVEGELLVGMAPLSWLALKIGPHVRSIVTDLGTQRWWFWEGRVRGQADLGTPLLRSYLEAWYVFSANVDLVEGYDGGNGIEGGIRGRLTRFPLWAELAYRIDHSRLAGGDRTQTVEELVLMIGVTFGG
jgi:hypothetical protein